MHPFTQKNNTMEENKEPLHKPGITLTIGWDEFVAAAIRSLVPAELAPNKTLDPKSLYAYKYGNHGEIENAFSISGPPTAITLTLCENKQSSQES